MGMDRWEAGRRGPLLVGVVLVVTGFALLVAQQTGIQVGWPVWIIVPGLAIFLIAVALGGEVGSGFAALGGIVTSVGCVLAVQDAYHVYASWAYAWALVAPGGVGLGLFLYGILTQRWEIARGGLGALVAGIAIFLVGFLFFEGVLGLDGRPSGPLAELVVPGALVLLGLLVIVASLMPRRWWGPPGWRADAGWASNPSPGPTAGGGPTGGRAGTAASGAGTAASGAGPSGASPETLAVPLGGASTGEVALAFGAGRLEIAGASSPGDLVDGSFRGGVRREDGGPGRVRLSTPGQAFWGMGWDRVPFEWRLGLSAEVPLRLSIEVGAARTLADLSALRVTELRIRTGASETEVVLPAAAGFTRVDAEGGAAALRFRVPPGVAARIRTTVALGSSDIDTGRFPRDPLGGWASPDFETAGNKVEIEFRGGVGSVSVR